MGEADAETAQVDPEARGRRRDQESVTLRISRNHARPGVFTDV